MAACRHCGAELPGGARFCPACGTAVSAPRGEERKVVTVLFADLVDSTVAGDGADPEDVRAAVRPQLTRMRAELERYGGTFEKYVGDAVMAVFGAPVAHEDDAERAVRAALAIRDAIPGVKVAVNTGEAVVQVDAASGAGEGIATGDVVTTTFRIEEAADAGTVLVGESTLRATTDGVEYGARRILQAKGKSHPIAVYEALRPRSDDRPLSRTSPLVPLVGRREELSLVLDTIARARRDRTVQLITLVGVPGIGKSRLVYELERALDDVAGMVAWRRGRCLPYGDGVAYWALGEMVKQQTSILESDDAATAARKLSGAVAAVVNEPGEAAWVEAHCRALLGLDGGTTGPARRDEAFSAWQRLFEALAADGPLVLVFEDLHWADQGLLDFIDHVADWSVGYAIVLLCTARPELRDRRPAWGARPNAATVLLPPLSAAETETLLGFLLQQASVPDELRERLLARAEGNPLYAEEFVRMLIDRGLLRREAGSWHLLEPRLPVPDSVHAIIAARVDALAADEKSVLRTAAVVGRGFWPGAVAAAAGVAPRSVEERLRALERKELVRRRGGSAVAGETQYSFHHALIRDVAYGQIPRAERVRLHCIVAEWIEALGRPEDHAETIAHHYLSALEYAAAAHEDTSSFADAAVAALGDAGRRALALAAHERAARHFEAALALVDEGTLEHARLLAGVGKARAAAGEGLEELEAASARLLEVGEKVAAAEANVLAARLLVIRGEHADAADRFDRALGLVADADDSAEKAVVLANVAGFRMATDRNHEAIALAREALELARRFALAELEAASQATIGSARVAMGDVGGTDDLEESVRIAAAAGSPEVVRAYLNLGSLVANLGDVRRAGELHSRGRAAAERFGDRTRLRWFDAERLYQLYWAERWDEARALADELLEQIGEGESHVAAFDAFLVRGWIELAEGNRAAAADDGLRALDLGRSFGASQLLFPALAFAARVQLAASADEAAAALADELLDAWAKTRTTTLPSFWVCELASVLRALDRGDELAANAADTPRTRWLDAALAVARRDDEQAARIYREIGTAADERVLQRGGESRPVRDPRPG